jgi:hypothetical protein
MLRFEAIRTQRQHLLGRAFLVSVAGILAPALAHAHFVLVTPDAWMSQDALGLPEKLGPCGDEGGGTPTGTVTAFRPGQTIAVTINEVVTHPGHYRVALAVNHRSELPPEPMVTPTESDPCASAAIQSPPTFPILADNVLPHTQAFGAPQTFTVTLPTNVTCTKCTLQVLEFMSSHSAPCFYHHCADISIQEALETASPTASPTVTNTQTPTSTPAPGPASCVGDCNADGVVTIDELVRLVHLALNGDDSPSICPGNEQWCSAGPVADAVAVTCVVTAVNNALDGCSPSTSRPSPTPTF